MEFPIHSDMQFLTIAYTGPTDTTSLEDLYVAPSRSLVETEDASTKVFEQMGLFLIVHRSVFNVTSVL